MFVFHCSGHAIPETVTVSIALQGETLFQQPFEYFDDNPKLPDDIFRGDLNAVLHRTYDNIGSFLNKAGAAGGASNNGSGSGGNYGNQGINSSLCLIHVLHSYYTCTDFK